MQCPKCKEPRIFKEVFDDEGTPFLVCRVCGKAVFNVVTPVDIDISTNYTKPAGCVVQIKDSLVYAYLEKYGMEVKALLNKVSRLAAYKAVTQRVPLDSTYKTFFKYYDLWIDHELKSI